MAYRGPAQIRIPAKKTAAHSANFIKSFTEGFHYTFQSYPIRTLIILLAVLSLAGLPFIVLLPAYAKETLHGSSDTLGYLMSAPGAGVLTAALYMASRKTVIGLGKLNIRLFRKFVRPIYVNKGILPGLPDEIT